MGTSAPRTPVRTTKRMFGPYRHGLRWRVQIREAGTVRYETFGSEADASAYVFKARGTAKQNSDLLLAHVRAKPSGRKGWVYAIATAPDLSDRRIKVGFSKSLTARVSSLRTSGPTCILLAIWEADPADEHLAHRALSGRIGHSECFMVRSVASALDAIDAAIGPRVSVVDPGFGSGRRPRLTRARHATARQKQPKPNGNTPIAEFVVTDVRARQALGQRRYGVDLQANNGRDALVDAYQEALDLAMYLRQLLEERTAPTTATNLRGNEHER